MWAPVFLVGISAIIPAPDWKHGRAILERATEWELFSLDPFYDPKKGPKLDAKELFRKERILGKTIIKGERRKTLLTALDKGIADEEERLRKEREKGLLTETGCFMPRHGIRAKFGEQTVDVLICFECRPIHFYLGEGKKWRGHTLTDESPQPAFDKVLKDAGVKLAPRIFKTEEK